MKKISTLCVLLCMVLGLSAQTVVLSEDFSLITDSTSSSIANSINSYTQTTGWTADWVYPCTGKIKVGKSSAAGFIQTPALDLSAHNGNFTLSFDAEAWYHDQTKIKISVNNDVYTIEGLENDGSYGSYTHFEVPFTGGTAATTIKFEGFNQSGSRFFIDNIVVTSQEAGPDVTAPQVSSVLANANTLDVTFSEVLDATTAQNVANYNINNNITVSSATLAGRVVTLAVTPNFTEGTEYTLIVNNIADTTGNIMTPDTLTFHYGVAAEFQCANIAELRSKLDFSDYTVNNANSVEYQLTGEVIVTATATYNNQKVIQDATGAILIFDPDGKIGTLEVGDKISNLFGTLTNYYGFLEFKPSQSFTGAPIDIFQDVTPLNITLNELNDNTFMAQHQAELIQLNNVTFNSTGNFTKLNIYNISQNGVTADAVYPYFQDANYLGTEIPTVTVPSLSGVNFATTKVGNATYAFRYYIVPRFLSDFNYTSINNYNKNVSVWPNPTTNNVTFQIESEVRNAVIYDINGKRVAAENANNNTISMAGLNAGMYFVRLYNAQNEMIGAAKIVKF